MIPSSASVRAGQIWQRIEDPNYQIIISKILKEECEWNFEFIRPNGTSDRAKLAFLDTYSLVNTSCKWCDK